MFGVPDGVPDGTRICLMDTCGILWNLVDSGADGADVLTAGAVVDPDLLKFQSQQKKSGGGPQLRSRDQFARSVAVALLTPALRCG